MRLAYGVMFGFGVIVLLSLVLTGIAKRGSSSELVNGSIFLSTTVGLAVQAIIVALMELAK